MNVPATLEIYEGDSTTVGKILHTFENEIPKKPVDTKECFYDFKLKKKIKIQKDKKYTIRIVYPEKKGDLYYGKDGIPDASKVITFHQTKNAQTYRTGLNSCEIPFLILGTPK